MCRKSRRPAQKQITTSRLAIYADEVHPIGVSPTCIVLYWAEQNWFVSRRANDARQNSSFWTKKIPVHQRPPQNVPSDFLAADNLPTFLAELGQADIGRAT
jgi:hypothetical protein